MFDSIDALFASKLLVDDGEEEAKGTVYFFRLGHHIYFTGFLGKTNGGSQFFWSQPASLVGSPHE